MKAPVVKYGGMYQGNEWCRFWTRNTMKKNDNNLISVVGATGSGKTWSAISICEIMSRLDGVPFTVDHIVFSLKELMTLINSGELKRGSKIIFDEPQCSISSKDFQSTANKVFNLLISTFRHRNISLFFCTPFENLLDKSTRRLFKSRVDVAGVNLNRKTCKVYVKQIHYTDFKDQPYRFKLVVLFTDKEGRRRQEKLDYWNIPMPKSKELIEQYEAKKLAFTNNLNRNIMKELDKFDKNGRSMTSTYQQPEIDTRKPLTDRQRQVMTTLANIKESNKLDIATNLLGSSKSTLSESKSAAEKKGYKLEEFINKED